jgi:hypothetical protein
MVSGDNTMRVYDEVDPKVHWAFLLNAYPN